ncbi:MAG: hypothetical protein OXT67_01240, partial [Zetaproteobacteria bacterium]|nr:hypothetical protein [Zetaproteobacteria bacterium]
LYHITRSLSGQRFCAIGDKVFHQYPPLETIQGLVEVLPYWDPVPGKYVAHQTIAGEHWCKSDMSGCFKSNYGVGGYAFDQALRESYSLEPGRMIAKILVEDRDYADALTTTDGVIDGRTAYFYNTLMWPHVDALFPPGSYPGRESEKPFTTANPLSGNPEWIDRGPNHAGVLSTIAFHRVTNGRRAKANRLLNVFMCRKYRDVEGVQLTPSEEDDLTRRPYCKVCHLSLEPLANFFSRWPSLGDTNYFYNASPEVYPRGILDGKSGVGMKSLAKLVVEKEEYLACAVNHLYRFMLHREPSPYFVNNLLPRYVEQLKSSNRRLKPVFKQLLIDYIVDPKLEP